MWEVSTLHADHGKLWAHITSCHSDLSPVRFIPQLYVRRHFFFPPGRLIAYYDGVTSQVRAETQVMGPSGSALEHIAISCQTIPCQTA